MTVGLSATNTANKMLDALRGVSFSNASTYVALHVGDPGSAGTANGSSGSSARSQVTFGAASAGSISLTSTQPSWTNGGTTETITHVSVWSTSGAGTGNFLWSAQLGTAKSWASADVLTLTSMSLALSPIAA